MILVLLWLVPSILGAAFSYLGLRDARRDTAALAAGAEPPLGEIARSTVRSFQLRLAVQAMWVLLGLLSFVLPPGLGLLVLWGLVASNFVLLALSIIAYLDRKRILAAIITSHKEIK